jgi:hypothetical protein
MTEIDKARLLDLLGVARSEPSVLELHTKLREHFLAEAVDRYLDAPERELSASERAVWGVCPVCGAEHDEVCHYSEGWAGQADQINNPHHARLDAAPRRVRLVAVS